MHLIYTIIVIMLLGLLSLNVMQSVGHTERRMVSNEVLTQVTGVADEVFEHAATYWFDERVDENDWPIKPIIFPIITESQAGELTSTTTTPTVSTDGWGGCDGTVYQTDANMKRRRLINTAPTETCDDLDDLHGLMLDVVREEMTYAVEVSVAYVNPNDVSQIVSGPTFAKAVTLIITTPNYVMGSSPLEVELTQVFTYTRLTTAITP